MVTQAESIKIAKLFKEFLKKKNKEFNKLFDDKKAINYFTDVKVYPNKQMKYIHNSDESKGWTGTMSVIDKKKKNSNVVILVTYDGDGYDWLTYDSSASVVPEFEDLLNKKYKGKYNIEHSTNWAFEVFKEQY